MAAAMCDALGRPAGAAWLVQLNEEHLRMPIAAICQHGAVLGGARLCKCANAVTHAICNHGMQLNVMSLCSPV